MNLCKIFIPAQNLLFTFLFDGNTVSSLRLSMIKLYTQVDTTSDANQTTTWPHHMIGYTIVNHIDPPYGGQFTGTTIGCRKQANCPQLWDIPSKM